MADPTRPMSWDDFAASLDAGATVADFFPSLHEVGRNSSESASDSAGGDAKHESGKKSLGTALLYENLREQPGKPPTQLFYSRSDCCAYGLGAGVVVPLKDRAPMFINTTVESMGIGSYNLIDIDRALEMDERDKTQATNTPVATIEDAGGDFSSLIAGRKHLHQKLTTLASPKCLDVVRSGWIRQQATSFADYSEADWVEALTWHTDIVLHQRDAEEDKIAESWDALSPQMITLLLSEIKPAQSVAIGVLRVLHLVVACHVLQVTTCKCAQCIESGTHCRLWSSVQPMCLPRVY